MGAFRSTLYQAGQRLGSDAASLLEQIPDGDLRLFAAIELAAALAGAPPSPITSMKHPHPPGSQRSDARIISARCTIANTARGVSPPPYAQSRWPSHSLLPNATFSPSDDSHWSCKCGHAWNTFWTAGKCPACGFQWEETICPHCGEISDHRARYVPEP